MSAAVKSQKNSNSVFNGIGKIKGDSIGCDINDILVTNDTWFE